MLAMRAAQRAAKRDQRKRRNAHLAAGRKIVEEAGLRASPLGERIAVRLGDVEFEIEQLRKITDRVGRTKRTGDLSPAFERYLALQAQDRVELRNLIDRLVELQANAQLPGDGSEVIHVVRLSDGRALDLPAMELEDATPGAVDEDSGEVIAPDIQDLPAFDPAAEAPVQRSRDASAPPSQAARETMRELSRPRRQW